MSHHHWHGGSAGAAQARDAAPRLSSIGLADQIDEPTDGLATGTPLQAVSRRPLKQGGVEGAPNRTGKSIEGLEFV